MARRKVSTQEAAHLPTDVVDRIRADVGRWEPGLWAAEHPYGPACVCGMRGGPPCWRHEEER